MSGGSSSTSSVGSKPRSTPGTVTWSADRGTPQGSAISPLLANLYLHYAFDAWMAREFPAVPFERYADDVVVHCKSERQARFVLGEIEARMGGCHLALNQDKTRIVYCKDSNRKGSHEHERFDFLGYTFRPRKAKNPGASCSPASSLRSATEPPNRYAERSADGGFTYGAGHPSPSIAREMQQDRAGLDQLLRALLPNGLSRTLMHIDTYLVRWAMRKFKRLRGQRKRGWKLLADVSSREPELFAHWRLIRSAGRMVGAV